MNFKAVHNNYNVFELEKSMRFYETALGLHETGRIAPEDGSFLIVYMGNSQSEHLVELTWLRGREKPYDLGDNEVHLAFATDDYEGAHSLHKEMGCICFENPEMGIYFISDPDGYWIEIIPQK